MLNKNAIPRPKRRQVPELPPAQEIIVRGDHITLGQLLKVAGILSTGGEAKLYLADTVVQVNGEPEQRRGRKLRAGDLILAPSEAPIRLIAPPEEEPALAAVAGEMQTPRAKNKPGGDTASRPAPASAFSLPDESEAASFHAAQEK